MIPMVVLLNGFGLPLCVKLGMWLKITLSQELEQQTKNFWEWMASGFMLQEILQNPVFAANLFCSVNPINFTILPF